MVKNRYEIHGNETIIFIKRKIDGVELKAIIDTEDLERVMKANSIYAVKSKISNNYYILCRINNIQYQLHRYILNIYSDDSNVVDHENHNTLDNRKQNLRIVTHAINMQNRNGPHKNCKLGIRGVYYEKRLDRYVAEVKVNKKKVFRKRCKTIEEAEKAAIEARKKYHVI